MTRRGRVFWEKSRGRQHRGRTWGTNNRSLERGLGSMYPQARFSGTSETPPQGSLDQNIPYRDCLGIPTTRIRRQLSTLSPFLLAPFPSTPSPSTPSVPPPFASTPFSVTRIGIRISCPHPSPRLSPDYRRLGPLARQNSFVASSFARLAACIRLLTAAFCSS